MKRTRLYNPKLEKIEDYEKELKRVSKIINESDNYFIKKDFEKYKSKLLREIEDYYFFQEQAKKRKEVNNGFSRKI